MAKSPTDLTETDVAGNFQTYCFERTKDKITWSLNNQTVRTIVREARNSTTFPYRDEHRLSKVAISFWDGGSGSEGTSLWSGGPTDVSLLHILAMPVS
jgi:beta-glucanase (GH16 family)